MSYQIVDILFIVVGVLVVVTLVRFKKPMLSPDGLKREDLGWNKLSVTSFAVFLFSIVFTVGADPILISALKIGQDNSSIFRIHLVIGCLFFLFSAILGHISLRQLKKMPAKGHALSTIACYFSVGALLILLLTIIPATFYRG